MERPRVKRVFAPIPIGGGRIRIGGFDLGLAAEIQDDENGNTWRLLGLLDGSHTREAVAAAMQAADPPVPLGDVETAIDQLASEGYLEDAAAQPPAGVFSPAEIERYQRNFEYLSHFHEALATSYDFQARLKRGRVTIVGIGGVGSYTALALTALGVGDLYLIDDDRVELANLNRQIIYSGQDVGAFKADAAAARLAVVNPHVHVSAQVTRIDGPQAARDSMIGRDLVVCAADRPRVRIYQWFNQAALAERAPWIRVGTSGLTLSAFMHVPYETACFDCVQRNAADEVPWWPRLNAYLNDLDLDINPCIAPVAGLAGSIAAMEVAKRLTGTTTPATLGRRLIFDLARMEITYAPVGRRRPDCPACGSVEATNYTEG